MSGKRSRSTLVGVLIAAVVLVMIGGISMVLPLSAAERVAEPVQFDKDGNVLQPKGYREWIYVGTPLTPNDLNGGKATFPEFHNVYINPASFKVWKKTGKFPEGTVMVKELISVGDRKAPSGNGYFMDGFYGLECAVKDSKRFPKEPHNWAYFSFTNEGHPPNAKAKAKPTDACNTCHDQNAADDGVFTQYYPVLKAAKGGGK